MTFPRALLTAFLAIGFGAGVANADTSPKERAAELDAEAGAAIKNQDARTALALYEEALTLDTTPERICNVGMAHFQLDALPPAYFFLGQCLKHASQLPASRVASISKAYAYVDRNLQAGAFAQVEFTATAGKVTVLIPQLGAGAAFSTPRTVWLPLGEQTYQARADGYETSSEVVTVIKAAQKKSQHVSIALKEVVVPSVPTVDHTSEPSPIPPTKPVTSISDGSRSSKVPAWITLSSGAAFVVVGGVFHLRAAQVRSDLEGLPSGESRTSLIDDLKRERTIMAGFYGVGVVALGVGTFLMLSGDDKETQESPRIGLQLGTSSIGVHGSF